MLSSICQRADEAVLINAYYGNLANMIKKYFNVVMHKRRTLRLEKTTSEDSHVRKHQW
ncbi:conserved hypothetical protein, partial [Trichinella spiralis]|uniref:hypothetical protein n=1 Tax=Trichinella spiralis TaxID=6334 RepID=UPI0001EFDBE0